MNAIIKNLNTLYNYGCEHRPYAILNDYLEYILANESAIPEAIQELIPVILTYTELHEMFPESNHIKKDYDKLESKLIQTIAYYTNHKLKPAINYNNIEYNHYIIMKLKSEYNIHNNKAESAPQGADRTLTSQLVPDDNKPMPEAAGMTNTGNLNIDNLNIDNLNIGGTPDSRSTSKPTESYESLNPEASGAETRVQSNSEPASTTGANHHMTQPQSTKSTAEPEPKPSRPEQNPEAGRRAQSEDWEGGFAGRTLPSESQESRAGGGKSLSLAPISSDELLIKPDDFPTAIRFMLK